MKQPKVRGDRHARPFAALGVLRRLSGTIVLVSLVACGHDDTANVPGSGNDSASRGTGDEGTGPIPVVPGGGGGPVLVIDRVEAQPGTQVVINVTLINPGGSAVAGLQNDTFFDYINASIAARSDGQPACAGNPDINKNLTSFVFQPPACVGAECTSVRALVLAIDNVDPSPDGALLYTCTVDVAATATGTIPLKVGRVIMTTSSGMRIPASAVEGAIAVSGSPPSPATKFPDGVRCTFSDQCESAFCTDGVCCEQAECGANRCDIFGNEGLCTPRQDRGADCNKSTDCGEALVCLKDPALNKFACVPPSFPPTPIPDQSVELVFGGIVDGTPGQRVSFPVSLHTNDLPIAAAQNDLIFDSVHTRIAVNADGKPDCAVNPDIGKEATAFAFHPYGCAGSSCTSMRALVLSLAYDRYKELIPDGAVLYTCNVDISPDAAGSYRMGIEFVRAGTPEGRPIPGATGVDGQIQVGNATDPAL